jgi:hypothetical protein
MAVWGLWVWTSTRLINARLCQTFIRRAVPQGLLLLSSEVIKEAQQTAFFNLVKSQQTCYFLCDSGCFLETAF